VGSGGTAGKTPTEPNTGGIIVGMRTKKLTASRGVTESEGNLFQARAMRGASVKERSATGLWTLKSRVRGKQGDFYWGKICQRGFGRN